MRAVRSIVLCASVLLTPAAQATSLQVMPVLLDLENTGMLHLRNQGTKPVDAQVRVFRWVQKDGVETLEPTDAVAASPPLTTVQPGTDYAVRVVRETQAPAVGEEAYRLLIDELPASTGAPKNSVNLTVRSVIPVFFHSPEAKPAKVRWTISHQGGQVVLAGQNDGDQRLRIADLSILDGNRRSVERPGLFGYVLGHSTMKWRLPATGALGKALTIKATSQYGPYTSAVQIQ